MHEVKDSNQATVRIGFDGRVHKTFNGPKAKERFENEVRVLNYLESRKCSFVPRILETDPSKLYLVTTNCGAIVDQIGADRVTALFAELESFGVRHDDPFPRNITYNARSGRFNLIDFEFATILETGEGLTLAEVEDRSKELKRDE